jgi:antitoxin component YwqK of YwqJK toxin-antitoxin module
MRTTIFLCSCWLLWACDSNNKPKDENPTEAPTAEIILEEKTYYEADSSIKVVCQVDTKTKAKHGNYKEYDNATQTLMVERTYNQDKLTGEEKLYFSDGKLDAIINYKNGLHHGPFKYFHPNGQVKQSGAYTEGKVEGIMQSFYMDGTLKEEVAHQEGVTEGPFKEYNENGTIKTEGYLTTKGDQEDLDHGLLKMYDENGELETKMLCKHGVCCTIWTVAQGDLEPKNDMCKAIVEEMSETTVQ